MSMSSSHPYVGSSLQNLSLSDSRCNNDSCEAFYYAHKLSQATVSYDYQFKYGHFTTWYYLAFVGVFTFLCWYGKLQEHRLKLGHSNLQPLPRRLQSKLLALGRSISYRRFLGLASDKFGIPSVGVLVFLLLAALYLAILTFAVRPYYRQHRGYGSPPIGVRTGLMATALTPLLILLAGKANLITLMTGIGHERLNIIHRWVGWMTFILSVVHTVPFIVAPLHDGGYAALHKQFYKRASYEYTGVPPLAILFASLLFSIPYIRHRMYETFYHTHVWLATTYVGLLFWHAGDQGDSCVYLWATMTAWLLSWLARAFWFTRPLNVMASRWFIGSPITTKTYPQGMTYLQVLAPEGFTWSPGQHVYLRIPALNVFDNHPFTIASTTLPMDLSSKYVNSAGALSSTCELSFFIRTHTGFTHRLYNYLESHPDAQLRGWLEGPYGGIDRDLSLHFDDVVLVAGGSGISACLPWLEQITHNMRSGTRMKTSHVRLAWSIRERQAIAWIADILHKLDLSSLKGKIEVVVHVTRDATVESHMETPIVEKSTGLVADMKEIPSVKSKELTEVERVVTIHQGRINMTTILDDVNPKSSVSVIGCGPNSFKTDLGNACAKAQSRVLKDELSELWLWIEGFGL